MLALLAHFGMALVVIAVIAMTLLLSVIAENFSKLRCILFHRKHHYPFGYSTGWTGYATINHHGVLHAYMGYMVQTKCKVCGHMSAHHPCYEDVYVHLNESVYNRYQYQTGTVIDRQYVPPSVVSKLVCPTHYLPYIHTGPYWPHSSEKCACPLCFDGVQRHS